MPDPQAIYLDPDRSLEERLDDLLSRMTLEEKVSQMTSTAVALPHLGIPAYNYWNEALHGVARNGRATVFPQAIGLAATWDAELVQRIASAIGDEGRAKYYAILRERGESPLYAGLTFWSPNINIFRDPRWGRGQETWGEDPYLTGEMGAAFVRGLQGDHPTYLKTAACAKHFAVHSGPESTRHSFDARPPLRDLYATYLPAFEKLVREAGVESVMGAYNRVYGDPVCASPFLLEETLRQAWGFKGHVVSDCWALTDIHRSHHVTQNALESAALALKAGCDLSCVCTYDRLGEAVAAGLVSEALIDRSLRRSLATRFKLGMFDPPERVPYAATGMEVVGCPTHKDLAYEAALKSVVLLKNRDGFLPIRPETRSIMVVGPNAANLDALLGNYSGVSEHMTTLLEGIAGGAGETVSVQYRRGCQLTQPAANAMNYSIFESALSNVTIACMGLSPMLEGEEGESLLTPNSGDRDEIGLPAVQVDFLRSLAATGSRIVLVLTGGSPIALGEVEDMVQAVVQVWYPGQAGGRALADILFGRAAPSGKMPVSTPRSLADLPPFEEYSMAGRTYRYSQAEPLYPFGFGLSYTRFEYSDLRLDSQSIPPGEAIGLWVTLRNTGAAAGEEVAQVYLTDLQASTITPLASLAAFQRVRLEAGQQRELRFQIAPGQMELVDDAGRRVLEPGEFRVTVGGCAPGPRGLALGAPEPQAAVFRVVGE